MKKRLVVGSAESSRCQREKENSGSPDESVSAHGTTKANHGAIRLASPKYDRASWRSNSSRAEHQRHLDGATIFAGRLPDEIRFVPRAGLTLHCHSRTPPKCERYRVARMPSRQSRPPLQS